MDDREVSHEYVEEFQEASRCNVFVRSRPLSENNKGSKSILSFPSFKELTVKDAKQETTYRFDRVFPTNADNTQVCDEVCQPLIEAFLGGCNSCFMVYGQTGSGKTHTILSDNGLVPQTIERVIKIINEDSKYVYNLIFSYLQIYQDKIYDLLVNAGTGPLKLREHPKEGIVVEGLSEFEIKTREKAHELLEQGRKKLIVAETNMVRSSSRSHALCMLKIEKTKIESVNEYPSEEIEKVTDLSGAETLECLKGKLYLCDLAGSERLKKTHVSGKRLVEARYINTSLLELGNVIHALAARNNPHIPFRNSKLTRLLKESLGGNSKASLMICVSPSIKDLKETKCSLNFGQRAMKVIKYSVPNVQVDYKALSEFLSLKLKELESAYRMERDNLRELKSKYRRSSKDASIDSSGESSPAHKQHLTTLIEETADLLSNSSIFHELSANELNEQMLIESNVHTFDHPDFLSTLSTPDTAVKIMDTIYPDRNNDWFRQWPNSQAFLQPVSPNDNTTIEHRDSGIQTDAEEDISPNFENLPLCETDTSYDIKTKMEFSKEIKEMGIQTDIPHSSVIHINIESIGTQYSNENVNLAATVTEKAINTCHFLELKEQNPSQGSTNQFLVSNTNCVVENSFSESPSAIAMSSNEIPAAVVMSTNESHSAIAMSSTESPSAIAMSSNESHAAIAMSSNESRSVIAMSSNKSLSAIAMSTTDGPSGIAMSSNESHSAIAMSANESPSAIAKSSTESHSAIAMSSTEIPAAMAMSSNESNSAIAMSSNESHSAIAMSSNESHSAIEMSTNESHSAIAMSSNESHSAIEMSTNESHSAIAMSSNESPSAIAMSSNESHSAIAMSSNESPSAIAMSSNESHSAIAMSTNESHSAIVMSSNESPSAIAMSINESPSAIEMSSNESFSAIAISSNESHSAIAMSTTESHSAIAMSSTESFSAIAMSSNESHSAIAMSTTDGPSGIVMSSNESHSAIAMSANESPSAIAKSSTESFSAIAMSSNESHSAIAMSTTDGPSGIVMSSNESHSAIAMSANESPSAIAKSSTESHSAITMFSSEIPAAMAMSSNESHSAMAMSSNESPSAIEMSTTDGPSGIAMSSNESHSAIAMSANESPSAIANSSTESFSAITMSTNEIPAAMAMSSNESHSAIAMSSNESHSAIAMSSNERTSAIAMSTNESHSAIVMSTNESHSAIAMSINESPSAIAMSINESHSEIVMSTNENESSDDTTEHLQQQTKISDLLINNKMLNEQPIIFPAADKPTEKISNFNSKNFNSNLVDNTSSQLHRKADGNLTRQTLLKNVDALQENISHKNKSDFSFEKQSTDQSILENDKIYNNKNKNSESQDNIRNEIKNDELFETYSNKSDNVQSEEDINLVDDKSKPSYSECHTMCSNIPSNVHTNVEVDVEEGEGFIKEVVFSGITNKLKEDSNYKEMKPIDLEKQIDKHVGALTGNDSLEICNTKVGSQHQQISPNNSKDSKHVKPESKSSVEPSSHVQTLLPDSKAILSKTTYVPLLLHESIECFCDESSEQANTDNVDIISKGDSNVEEVPVDIHEDLESSADNIDSIETDQKTLISSTVESFPNTTTAEDFKSHSPFKRRSVDESKFQLATRDPIAQLPESVETIVNKTAEGLKLGRHRKSKSLASIELVKNRSHENAGSMSSPASPQWKNNDTLTFGTFLRNKTSDLLEKLPSRKKSRESPRPVKKDVEEEMVGEAERSNKATATAQSKNSKECQGQLADTIFQDIHNLLLSPSKRKYSEPRLQTESSTQNSMKYETPERREIDHEDFKCRSSSGKEIMKFHENTEELQPEVRDSTNNMKQKLESMNDPYGFEIDETIQMQNAEGDNKDLEDNDNVLEEKIFSDFYLDEITKAPFNPSSPYFRKLEVVNGNNSTIEKPFSEGNDITQLSETFQKRDQAITCVKKDSYEPPIETYFNYLQNEIREELGKETSPNTLQTYIKADSCEVHSGDLNVKEASILRYSYASVDTSYDEYNSSTDGYMSSISTTSSYRRCSSADSETEYRMFKDTERAKKSLHKVKQKYEKILRQFEEVMEDKSLIEDELNTSRSCYDLVLKFKTELEVELQKAREQLQILKPDQEESADSYEHRRVSDSDETIAGDVDPFSEVDESFLSVDEHMEEIRNLPTMYFQTNSDSDNNSPSQSMGTSTPISQSKLNQFPSPNKRLDTLASSGPGLWFQKSFSKLSKEKAKRKEKLTLAAIENTEIKKELLLTKLEKNRLEAVLSCIMAESRDQPGLGMMRNLASSRSTVSSSCSNLPLGMSPNTYQPSPFRKYNFKDRFLAGADSSASTTPFARKKDTSTETSMFSLLSPDSSLSDFDISSMSDITSPSLLTRMSPYGEAIPEESIADNESQDMDELVRDMDYQDEQIPAGCLPFLKMRSARKKRKIKEKKKKAKIR